MPLLNTPVVIFCGGKATRFNNGKPGPLKPLIRVNKITIVERIMSLFYKQGFNNFILLSGYKHKTLFKYFKKKKKYKIKVHFTGLNSTTAERLYRTKHLISKNFFLTYGDSLANFNPTKALKLKKNKNMVVSVFKKNINYGVFDIRNTKVKNIYQKNFNVNINAGFYIADKTIFDYLKLNSKDLEGDVLNKFSKKHNLITNFVSRWYPMDDNKDKKIIEEILKKDTSYFD